MPAADSYVKGHIPGAVYFVFPKEVIKTWDDMTMPGLSQSDYEQLLGADKDRLIIVYCGFVKSARSHNAAVFAKELAIPTSSDIPVESMHGAARVMR